MRKLTVLIVLVLCAALGFGQKAPADYEALARTITTDLAARRFEKVLARFGPTIAKVLDAQNLAASWDSVIAKYGAFASIERTEQEETSGVQVVYVTTAFERGKLVLILAFDANELVVGFSSISPEARAGWKVPVYAKPDTFTERPITVTTKSWQLPGTLTIPSGAGPFPALVLVHGSGPNDQDEGIGPNKMFKDLAWGLASRGVAVLRYEKRTHKYGVKSNADPAAFTVTDETIDDVRSAVTQLTKTQGIDPGRVFVVGHSLGAYVAPRIATGFPQVTGLVLMAGNTRSLADLVVEQIRYSAALSGKVTPEGEKQIAAAEEFAQDYRNPDLKPGMTVNLLGIPLPASYVLDLRSYNPSATAAMLKIRILVLQGGRDYQVRVADFDGWKKALAGHANVAFKLYPALNHFFMPGAGPSSDAEYLEPNHVLEEVINDIAGWITNNK